MSNALTNLFNLFLIQHKFTNKFCNFCNKKIYLDNENCYYFQVFGLGKHDKKFICYQCFKNLSK